MPLSKLLFIAMAALGSDHGAEPAHAPQADHAAEGAVHGSDHASDMVEKPAHTSSRDVLVPQALVAMIEKEYREFVTKATGLAQKETIKRQLLKVSAELTQKRHAALHEDVRVVTPMGGGVIDLKEFVTPLRGAFRVQIQVKREDGAEVPASRVFYVSRAKTRRLAGEDYGAGCAKYMDITSHFHKKWSGEGLEVYTADQRYVSVLGGTFVFVDYQTEALSVASLTFSDSRFPELTCE